MARASAAIGPRFAAITTVWALAVGCSAEPLAPLQVAPLGRHEVPVGATLLLSIVASEATRPTITIVAGPATLQLLTPAETDQAEPDAIGVLAWQPSAFDLAPTPVGVARAPGKWLPVQLQVCDADERCADTVGSVRAVPAPSGP